MFTVTILLLSAFRVLNFLDENPDQDRNRKSDADAANTKPSYPVRSHSWPDQHWKPVKQCRLQVQDFTTNTLMEYFVQRRLANNAQAQVVASLDKAFRLFSKGYVQNIAVCSRPYRKQMQNEISACFFQSQCAPPDEGWALCCSVSCLTFGKGSEGCYLGKMWLPCWPRTQSHMLAYWRSLLCSGELLSTGIFM